MFSELFLWSFPAGVYVKPHTPCTTITQATMQIGSATLGVVYILLFS